MFAAQQRAMPFQYTQEHYAIMRGDAAELTWNELNMAIMGQVMALTCCDPQPLNSSMYRHASKGRVKNTVQFRHQGHRSCRKTFLFLHGIGDFRMRAIKTSYLSQVLVPRVHGHTGRIAPRSLILEDVRNMVKFVMQYAETNGILLPGRVPGYKRDDIQLLPCSTTKRAIWVLYQETCTTLSVRAVAYSTFCRVWNQFLRHIVVARPMTDLCWTCQQNSTAILRSANL